MARKLHHGNPDCCEPVVSYVLEDNEVIINLEKIKREFAILLDQVSEIYSISDIMDILETKKEV